MSKNTDNELDEKLDDASFLFGTTTVPIRLAAKEAKEKLSKTKRYRNLSKIGRLIRNIEQS